MNAKEIEERRLAFLPKKRSKYKCPKCTHREFLSGEIRASGGALSSMFDLETERFTAISCKKCGYTEFYRTDSSVAQNVLDYLVS